MSDRNWDDNSIQFPRLLSEIYAAVHPDNFIEVAEAMDLSINQVMEIFERADKAWQHIKAVTCPADREVREAKEFILLSLDESTCADDALDELVHETCSATAAGLNNAGPAAQLDFLLREGVELSHIANCLGIDLDEDDG